MLLVCWPYFHLFLNHLHLFELDYNYRYSMLLAGSLPFSIGASIYHFREILVSKLSFLEKPSSIFFLFGAFIANPLFVLICRKFSLHDLAVFSYYTNYVVNALIVIGLIRGKIPFFSARVDQVIGDFSYPIYLLHWQVGFFASMLLFGVPVRGLSYEGVFSFLLASAICVFISLLIKIYVDAPIQRVRKRMRTSAQRALSD